MGLSGGVQDGEEGLASSISLEMGLSLSKKKFGHGDFVLQDSAGEMSLSDKRYKLSVCVPDKTPQLGGKDKDEKGGLSRLAGDRKNESSAGAVDLEETGDLKNESSVTLEDDDDDVISFEQMVLVDG